MFLFYTRYKRRFHLKTLKRFLGRTVQGGDNNGRLSLVSPGEYDYRRNPVSTGNTFQDQPRLRETADNTERCI